MLSLFQFMRFFEIVFTFGLCCFCGNHGFAFQIASVVPTRRGCHHHRKSANPNWGDQWITTTTTSSLVDRDLVRLNRSRKPTTEKAEDEEDYSADLSIRFLGRGSNAMVRLGCVLVAPSNEFHHFYRQSAIFVYAMGQEDRKDNNNNSFMIQGVILDYPTPFTLREMMDQNPRIWNDNPLGENFLFRGGDKGNDKIILLHNQKHLGQAEIGTSGIFQGDWPTALPACASGSTPSKDFKAFFNYCEFTEIELEDMLDSNQDGDAWMSVEVDADFILDQDFDRGDAWTRIRNAIKQMNVA